MEVDHEMAEEAAAARGEEEYDGAVTPHAQNKTDGRDEALPRRHPVLIEMAWLLARSEARRLRG